MWWAQLHISKLMACGDIERTAYWRPVDILVMVEYRELHPPIVSRWVKVEAFRGVFEDQGMEVFQLASVDPMAEEPQ